MLKTLLRRGTDLKVIFLINVKMTNNECDQFFVIFGS